MEFRHIQEEITVEFVLVVFALLSPSPATNSIDYTVCPYNFLQLCFNTGVHRPFACVLDNLRSRKPDNTLDSGVFFTFGDRQLESFRTEVRIVRNLREDSERMKSRTFLRGLGRQD